MQIYLINLARRPDRRTLMEAQGSRMGLSFTRIDAVDAQGPEPDEPGNDLFAAGGPLGEIPRGDKSCTLSHIKAWKMFLGSGDSHAAILEDDVALSDDAAAVLKTADWIPAGVDVLKLEHYGPMSQRVLLSDFTKVAPGWETGFQIARMHSRHTGAAAYILTRRAAGLLVAATRIALPVDHLIFNPNNSPLFASLAPWQLLPAVARQQDFIGEKSDIESWRIGMRKLTPAYVRRELIRFGYDLRLVPHQLGLLATGRAKFVGVSSRPPDSKSA
jgi:glycosyl transferase family 25